MDRELAPVASLKTKNYWNILWDVFFTAILSAASLFLMHFYFKGNLLNTGYPDWMKHAFFIKQLGLYGLSPWSHTWANGINLWRSFQFIPQIITLGFSQYFHVPITRAMVLLTIIQFILLRFFIYGGLRFLKISPLAAFLCALISFDIPHYWKAVADYTFLFAVTFFPILLLLWIQYFKGKLQYLYPFFVGASFVFHPVLASYGFYLWITGIFLSGRKVLSLSNLMQFFVFVLSSSYFWLPVTIFRQPYAYTSGSFALVDFFVLAVKPYGFYGLSIYVFGCLVCTAFFLLFFANRTQAWMRALFLFAVVIMGLIILGNYIQLPKFIAQTQFARGIIFMGIAFIFTFAPAIDYLLKTKWFFIKALAAIIFPLLFVESISFTSSYAPAPFVNYDEPISHYAHSHPDFANAVHRVYTPLIESSSYYAPNNIYFIGSYNEHLDSNPIPPRLTMLTNYQPFDQQLPTANLDRLENYFKVTGADYLFFDETSVFSKELSEDSQEYVNLGRLDLPYAIFHVFKVNWSPRKAVLIDPRLQNRLNHFSFTLNIDDLNDQVKFDDYIGNFSKLIYDKNNVVLPAMYPTQTSLAVYVPANRNSNQLYINESYDTDWKAYFNGQPQPITPVGPNYMLVKLNNTNDSGTLLLKNSWPLYYYISLIIILDMPVIIFIFSLIKYAHKNSNIEIRNPSLEVGGER